MMKKVILLVVLCLAAVFALGGCGAAKGGDAEDSYDNGRGEKLMYESITPKQAKELMDTEENYIILDVREQSEYDEGHIPKAVLIPHTEIENRAEELMPGKEQLILVYCRSGRRSKIAAESLARLGYTNVKEFGGIIDWPYEVEK
ncbi:MAG: rhodanese-like domain-containing protein [Monoglobaceae bacterium]